MQENAIIQIMPKKGGVNEELEPHSKKRWWLISYMIALVMRFHQTMSVEFKNLAP